MKIAKLPSGDPEIFYTLQGEGRNTGLPSVFIRASLCNLYCTWCDTPYTWNWDDTDFTHQQGKKYHRSEQIIDCSIEEILVCLEPFPCRNYVFTGGEPLLQAREWLQLMQRLQSDPEKSPPHFEIETNGTLFPAPEFVALADQFNVSPKLSGSKVSESKRSHPQILRKFADTGKADFKFVVGSETDLDEVLDIADSANLPSNRIFLMAEAATPEQLEANQHFASEAARKMGVRYSDRLHLRLYRAKRAT